MLESSIGRYLAKVVAWDFEVDDETPKGEAAPRSWVTWVWRRPWSCTVSGSPQPAAEAPEAGVDVGGPPVDRAVGRCREDEGVGGELRAAAARGSIRLR